MKMLKIIVTYYRMGQDAIKQGATLIKLRKMKVINDIARMKFSVENEKVEKLDQLQDRLVREMNRLGEIYARFE